MNGFRLALAAVVIVAGASTAFAADFGTGVLASAGTLYSDSVLIQESHPRTSQVTALSVSPNYAVDGIYGSSLAIADLRTGGLGIVAQATPHAGAEASAGLFTELRFLVNGVPDGERTQLNFSLTLDGALAATQYGGGGDLTFEMTLGEYGTSSYAIHRQSILLHPSGLWEEWGYHHAADEDAGFSYIHEAGLGRYFYTYNMIGDAAVMPLAISLHGAARDGAFANFGHTLTFGFHLPSNVTVSDSSGIFLVPGVPEPSTWAMMIVSFGMIGARMRRLRSGGGQAIPVRTDPLAASA